MPIGANMPTGTKVKDASGNTGKTVEYLKNKAPSGGYKVMWDKDSTETELHCYQLDLAGGSVSEDSYQTALALITKRLGGITETPEGNWLDPQKGLVASVLVVSNPSHLGAGEVMHAHVGTGGAMHKAHVKSGNNYVRSIFEYGACTSASTKKDKEWVANYKLRKNMQVNKQNFMDSKVPLPT